MSYQKGIACNTQGGMMRNAARMETTPNATLIMIEPDLVFELLIVTLDMPPLFGRAHFGGSSFTLGRLTRWVGFTWTI